LEMAKATGTMKRRVSFLWANPIEIDSWITGKNVRKFEIARGAGIPQLLLFGGGHFFPKEDSKKMGEKE